MILDYSKHKAKAKREQSIYTCLEEIKSSWKGDVGGLIQDWSEIAGEQLALNCTPLNIQNKILTIGSSHPHWRQALIYNGMQLIASLKSYGYQIKDINNFFQHLIDFHTNQDQEADNSLHEENGHYFTVTEVFFEKIKEFYNSKNNNS